ncbi:Protein BMH2 [Tritrichomonas foetus]|uniref:Protein BMH2 n=1 Tax=Tritrichomonas foetus TaxID=1144522 RepID=A0A1J4K740_9EUKA|nr:Protein BMH2 [Tritrichomonas foetus]|eukprot:OHT07191.1 Protein BMH2 [Tritrichomonas foetus]
MNPTQEDLIYFCRLYHAENRDKEALETIKQLVDLNPQFDRHCRQIFQAIYKQIIDSLRFSLQKVATYYKTDLELNKLEHASMLLDKKNEFVNRLILICREAISIVDDQLLPNSIDIQTSVYFYKFKGDLYRYISEYSDETDSIAAANHGEECYKEALSLALTNLEPSDPARLSLILNAAVFRYEIRKETDKAIEMLNSTLLEAKNWDFSKVTKNGVNPAETILCLMTKNLSLWCDSPSYEEVEVFE